MTETVIASDRLIVPRNGFGTAALVLGIVAVVFCWVPVLGVLLGVLVTVFGVVGVSRAKHGVATNRGSAVAGAVLGPIALVIGLFITIAAFATVGKISSDLNQHSQSGWSGSFPVPQPAAPGVQGITDGTWLVGKDIQPGTYKTAGPAPGFVSMCTWERLSSLDGGLNSIIDMPGVSQGQAYVTIAPTDMAFQTSGCSPWVK